MSTTSGASVADQADGQLPRSGPNDLPIGVWAMAPALATLYPGLLYQWVFGVYTFRAASYIATALITAAITIITWAVLYFLVFNRDARRSAGVAAVIIVVVFSWPWWTAPGYEVANLTGIGVLGDIVPVLLAGALLWVAVRHAGSDRFIFILVGVLVGLVVFLGYGLASRGVGAADASAQVPSSGPNPNVVILVLDGYARADVLASQYGFDNSVFLNELAERGFEIRADAVTNYSVTHTSLSSMVDAGYPFEEGAHSDASLDRMRRLLSGDGTLLNAFNSAGYDTLMFENAWAGSLCGGTPDRCHRTGLFSRSLWSLGQLSPLAAVQRITVRHPFTAIGLQHIRELGDVVESDESVPLFVFAHVTVPHPPTQLSPSCEFVVTSDRLEMVLSSSDSSEADRQEARRRYTEQVQCINREVLATVDRLIAADEEIEIVIIADHGPDSHSQSDRDIVEWTDAELIERLAVLAAVRMPPACPERVPARTTVNTVRRALRCALGSGFEDLPDRNFVAPAAQDIDEAIVEVTEWVDQIAAPSD